MTCSCLPTEQTTSGRLPRLVRTLDSNKLPMRAGKDRSVAFPHRASPLPGGGNAALRFLQKVPVRPPLLVDKILGPEAQVARRLHRDGDAPSAGGILSRVAWARVARAVRLTTSNSWKSGQVGYGPSTAGTSTQNHPRRSPSRNPVALSCG